MNNNIRVKVRTKGSVEEISSIISFEDLNICMELCLDHRMKVFENLDSYNLYFMRNIQLI